MTAKNGHSKICCKRVGRTEAGENRGFKVEVVLSGAYLALREQINNREGL